MRETDLPLSLSLELVGLIGVTAYVSLIEIGQPRPGETVVVEGEQDELARGVERALDRLR